MADQVPLILNHNPIQLNQVEKNVYGAIPAKRKACDRWLRKVINVESSKYPLGAKQACRDHTCSHGLKEELARLILMRDISVRTPCRLA